MFTRRQLLKAAGITAPALALPILGCSEEGAYPSKNITFIIPHGAGGGFDTFVRVISPAMQKYLPHKTNILPLNIAAGGGGKGVSQLYRAQPDGYTIGIVDTPAVYLLERRSGGSFEVQKFTWLVTLGQPNNYALAVRKDSPLKTLDDVLRLSAERPVKFCTSGPDGTSYMAAVIGTQILGIRTQFITGYKGSSDFIVGTLRGDGDAVIAASETVRPMFKTGDLRVLASFEPKSTFGDEVPDATDLGKEELSRINAVRLVGAPPNLMEDRKKILVDALNKAMVDPRVKQWADSTDYVKLTQNSPEEATAVVRQQAEFFNKWAPYLHQA